MNNLITYINHKKSFSFQDLLFQFIDKQNKKDAEIYKKADIDRKLFSKIRCNENYTPRKNVILKLCIALELDEEETKKLLNSAGYSLSSSKFDLIISYCIENKIYDSKKINDYLYDYCKAVL